MVGVGVGLGGCAGTVIGSLTLGQLGLIGDVVSTLATGRDLAEHALSFLLGRDCRFAEGALRGDRAMCELHGSPATEGDFQGIFAGDSDTKAVEAAPADAALIRYADAREREFAAVRDGLPEPGEAPRLVRLNGRIVYAMAPRAP